MPTCGRQARLKPCATNHPLGDFKPDLKPVAKEVFKKESLNLGVRYASVITFIYKITKRVWGNYWRPAPHP